MEYSMTTALTFVAGLASLSATNALPIGSGFAGISLTSGALNNFYSQEVTFSKLPVNVGFGWNKDGTLSAGIKFKSEFQGQSIPVAISFSGNVNNLKDTLKVEAALRLFNKLSGVILGDKNGLSWLTSLWLPVGSRGNLRSVGVSLEGERTRPVAISGGIGLSDSIYQARVELDKNMNPKSTNFLVSTAPSKSNPYDSM